MEYLWGQDEVNVKIKRSPTASLKKYCKGKTVRE